MSYYLTFIHNNLTYGIPAETVQEIFFLPQLSPIPEAPEDIIGAVNVRGDIIPVMDLNLRFGYESIDYNVNDNVVVVNFENLRLGIITNKVNEVSLIDESVITPELSHDQPLEGIPEDKFIAGVVQQEENVILLLNPEKLLRYAESQELSLDLDFFALDEDGDISEAENESITPEEKQKLLKKSVFFPKASDYERKLLEKRANNLRQSSSIKEIEGLIPMSIFTLNQEFFGIELNLVKEFIDFEKFTPIPCTPDFILGNINLRGEIITIIDIRGELNLSLSHISNKYKAVIVNIQGLIVGIVIDKINDIYMLNPENLQTPETHEGTEEFNHKYLQGVVNYKEKMLGILNLLEMFESGNLLVDEAV